MILTFSLLMRKTKKNCLLLLTFVLCVSFIVNRQIYVYNLQLVIIIYLILSYIL